MITKASFNEYELKLHNKRRNDDMLQKTTSRKRLKIDQSNVEFIKKDKLKMKTEKNRKNEEIQKKKECNNIMIIWKNDRDVVHDINLEARKNEKARVKRVKNLIKQGVIISDDLLILILDPETEWKTTNAIWKKVKAKKIKARMKKAEIVRSFTNENEKK